MKKLIIQKILVTTVILAVIFGVFFALDKAFQKEQVRYCTSLQAQAEENLENRFYYITPSDAAGCEAVNIIINAPIKNAAQVEAMYK